ncbi:MAG: putative toxin-antitoxin system toxin component, PIN family [Alphaproteobacteria bacterium]|nr:putative toxin-antitoxin system toxin component, PIN family [Alphaproteobacteria bacterium]
MKAVIDTNIFVGAIMKSGGIDRKVLEDCFKGEITPLMGDALYFEYESLLHREWLYENSLLSSFEREAFLDDLMSICRWVDVHYRWRPNLRDEGDNHVVELALAGGAERIVTWNRKDFRGGDLMFDQLRIITPADYLKERAGQWRR